MAITTNTVVCAKCERKIDLAYCVKDQYFCTPCMLENGTIFTNPRRIEADTETRKSVSPMRLRKTKARAKPKPQKQQARTDRQKQAGFCAIYAIQMRAGVVKVGRTTNWAVRKHSYTNGFDDVIKRCAIFRIVDDHEILPDIETALLHSLPHHRAKGYEWPFADFDEITTHTDAFLTANGIMFERE